MEFDKSILAQSDVITLRSFDFDKNVKVYYKDYANLENIHAEYVWNGVKEIVENGLKGILY